MDKFEDRLHQIGDWCAAHQKAVAVIVAIVVGIVIGGIAF